MTAGRWTSIRPSRQKLVVWGAGDQCRVNLPILHSLGCQISAFIDDTLGLASPLANVPCLQGQAAFRDWLTRQSDKNLGFVIAIGNPYGHIRCQLHDRLKGMGLEPVSFADPTALLCSSACMGDGLQVMPAAIIHNDVEIHRQCIVNTRSLVEHDCVLEEGAEIGPGATLCGRVTVGAHSWIGAGATVRPRIRIGRNAIVGAGATVVSDIPDGAVVVGTPARIIPGKTTASALAN